MGSLPEAGGPVQPWPRRSPLYATARAHAGSAGGVGSPRWMMGSMRFMDSLRRVPFALEIHWGAIPVGVRVPLPAPMSGRQRVTRRAPGPGDPHSHFASPHQSHPARSGEPGRAQPVEVQAGGDGLPLAVTAVPGHLVVPLRAVPGGEHALEMRPSLGTERAEGARVFSWGDPPESRPARESGPVRSRPNSRPLSARSGTCGARFVCPADPGR